jgi:hypothetical protein
MAARLSLWDETRMLLLVLWKQPNARSKNIAQAQLFPIVVTQTTASMQIQHQPDSVLRGGPKQPIRHGPIALVGVRLKLLFQPIGLFLECLDHRQPLR